MASTTSGKGNVHRAMGMRAAALAMMLALVAGCSGSDTATTASSSSVISASATIDSTGGTLIGPDGVTVVVPPGALDQPTTITITRTSAGAPAALDAYPLVGNVYEFTPHNLLFNRPVIIRAPVPSGALGTSVFMASPGEDWNLKDATVIGGLASWERNSFSWMYYGTGVCIIPASMLNDPYWCVWDRSFARISATPQGAMAQTAPPVFQNGDVGAYRVDASATLQFESHPSVAGNCSNVTVALKRRRFNETTLQWGPQVTLQTQSPALTPDGGRLNGIATFTLPFTDSDNGKNHFALVVSYDCPDVLRQGGTVVGWATTVLSHTMGDGMLVVGNITQPTVFHTVSGSISGLTGAGLVLLNNNGSSLAVQANDTSFIFTSIQHGSSYNVTVGAPPTGQTCTVLHGSGTASGNVTNVEVSCGPAGVVKAWQGAALLENIDLGDAYNPQVVFDTNGNGMAIWIQSDGTYLRVQSSRYTPNSGWGPILSVGTGGAQSALEPTIAVDGSGNVRAVWLQQVTVSTRSIWTNLYSPASGWGTATVLEASVSSVGGNSPEIAMDPAGNATVVWAEFDGNWTNLWARRYTAGGVWAPATLIEYDNNGGVGDQGVVMEANGNAMVVWSQFDGQRTNVLANRYIVGSGWGTPTPIETSDLNSGVSDIALDGTGNIMVVLHQQTSAASSVIGSIYTNRFSNGSWGTAALVKSAIPYLSQSAIAMNASGNAMVVWLEDDGFDVTSIWARAYTSAGVGGATVRIDNLSTYMDGRTPQVAMDASGNAVAVWGQGSHVWSARYVAGTGWGTPADIDNGAGGFPSNQPRIAVDASGNALAVWERPSGTFRNIWGNVFR